MPKFLDQFTYGGRYFNLMLVAAPLVAIGLFLATHGTPGAQVAAAHAIGCSTQATAEVVADIVRKELFDEAAGQALKASLDEDKFGGQLLDIVTESDKPLTCSADFVPNVHVTGAFLSAVAAKGSDPIIEARSVEKEIDERYTARLHYNVKHTDDGRLYVEVTQGLEVYDH